MRFFLSFCVAAASVLAASANAIEKLPFLIIIYGSQGSGKAAIAARLHVDYSLSAISPATYLTSNVLDETPLGNKAREYVVNGGPMPTDLIPSLICDRLLESDCCQGALMEDVLLTLVQMQAIQECLAPRFQLLAIHISTSESWILQKAESRHICRTCGKVFDILPSITSSKCDICASSLSKRQVDLPEAILARLRAYKAQLAPILEWHREQNTLIEVSGEKQFNDLYEEVASIIRQRTGILPVKSQAPLASE